MFFEIRDIMHTRMIFSKFPTFPTKFLQKYFLGPPQRLYGTLQIRGGWDVQE